MMPCHEPPRCEHLVQGMPHTWAEVLDAVVQDLVQNGEEPSIGASFERAPTPSFTDLELWQFETEDDLKVSCKFLAFLPKWHGVVQIRLLFWEIQAVKAMLYIDVGVHCKFVM